MMWTRLALVLATGTLWAAPATAQGGLSHFYCYAADSRAGKVLVSDVHEVGPVSERRAYGEQFADYLAARGLMPRGTQGYCVMRASQREIEQSIRELPHTCSTCGDTRDFEQVAWLREGKSAGALLAGKLLPPKKLGDQEQGQGSGESGAKARDAEPAGDASGNSFGAHVRVRVDGTDAVLSVNEENGHALVRTRADLKGGTWTSLLSDDRCPGWAAVAYASDGRETFYFYRTGAETEGEASGSALDQAESAVEKREGNWITGVLRTFLNRYEPPGISFEDGIVPAVKGEIRKRVTTGCGTDRGHIAVGTRG